MSTELGGALPRFARVRPLVAALFDPALPADATPTVLKPNLELLDSIFPNTIVDSFALLELYEVRMYGTSSSMGAGDLLALRAVYVVMCGRDEVDLRSWRCLCPRFIALLVQADPCSGPAVAPACHHLLALYICAVNPRMCGRYVRFSRVSPSAYAAIGRD